MVPVVCHFAEPLGIGTIHPRVHDVNLWVAEVIAKGTMANVVGVRFRAVIGFDQRGRPMEVAESDRHTGQNARHGKENNKRSSGLSYPLTRTEDSRKTGLRQM